MSDKERAALREIEESAKLALGSDNPAHWEAALSDILGALRKYGLEQAA